jgi:hypothetical protein
MHSAKRSKKSDANIPLKIAGLRLPSENDKGGVTDSETLRCSPRSVLSRYAIYGATLIHALSGYNDNSSLLYNEGDYVPFSDNR